MNNICQLDAHRERYKFSEPKTKIQIYNSKIPANIWNDTVQWKLNNKSIEVVTSHQHVGILREQRPLKDAQLINDRITIGRRAMYALFGIGMHGLNGLSPVVSYKIWSVYICSRMLHSLESVVTPDTLLSKMELFQREALRRIQHLSQRTANCAIYILLGALPLQAIIDKNSLKFFVSILRQPHSTENQLIRRQLLMKDNTSHSWAIHIKLLLDRYNLPSAFDLLNQTPSKDRWKSLVDKAVNEYWMDLLKAEANCKSTLSFLNFEDAACGKPHNIYSSLNTTPQDIKRAVVKAQLLTGTYQLAAAASRKLNPIEEQQCQLCKSSRETLVHFLTECPTIIMDCDNHLTNYKAEVTTIIGTTLWNNLECQHMIHQLILDCTSKKLGIPKLQVCEYQALETASRHLCFALHSYRLRTLKAGLKAKTKSVNINLPPNMTHNLHAIKGSAPIKGGMY